MTTTARRRASLTAAVALVVTSLGLTGWALRPEADRPEPAPAFVEQPVPQVTAGPTTSAAPAPPPVPAPVPGPVPAALPVPEDAPVDAYAPTPEVVHGLLELPTLGVSQPLGEGVTLTAINRGPSHWPGSAMPGQLGNVVVAGHRTTYTRPFHDLDLLAPGDPLVFRMNDGTAWTYEATGTEIVGPDAMHVVDQGPEHTATLIACHPKGSAAQRIVVHFRLAGPAPPQG
jgi:sortase A